MTWQNHVDKYLSTISNDATRRKYGYDLQRFLDWYRQSYGEDPEPEMITETEAQDWRAHMLTVDKYAASTVNGRLSALTGLVRHAGGRLDVDYVQVVEKPVDPLTGRELGRLIRAVEQNDWGPEWWPLRNVAMVSIMARAGLRVGECVALDLGDVEIRERSGWARIRQGKGMKERDVPLSLQCRKDLQAYLETRPKGHPALFVTRFGDRISRRSVSTIVAKARRRAGIDHCTPHTLRHTFATRFLRKGDGDVRSLQRILGHSNLETTARYLHPDAQEMQKMVEHL